jgi:hypothetical protein
MFLSIPNDPLILIRSYLIVDLKDNGKFGNELFTFIRQESERNWRNLLSTSNNQNWKRIRKETMIWSLSGVSMRKYYENQTFRQYVNERMVSPRQQLRCNYDFSLREDSSLTSFMVGLAVTSNISCVSITAYPLTEFPSSPSLRTLFLFKCSSLRQLGDFLNLTTLHVEVATNLEKVGDMGNITHIYLEEVKADVITQFTLEQIESLTLIWTGNSFADLRRLKSIKDLFICRSSSHSIKEFKFSALHSPHLSKLGLENFHSVDLRGAFSLKHLYIKGTSNDEIIGKEDVYPQLKSFTYFSWYDFGEPATFYESNLQNVTDLTLKLSVKTEIDNFVVSDKIKSIDLNVQMKHLANCPDSRTFSAVRLHSCSPKNYSVFSNVQILTLCDCRGVRDVYPFRNVPYLILDKLTSVEDFSCLGNQKYLHIVNCNGLSDEAMTHFGNVFHLFIVDCHQVTHVKGLNNNRFIRFHVCHCIQSVDLPGREYIRVSMTGCPWLLNLNITGKVYSLEVTKSNRWDKEFLARHCDYVNGEETRPYLKTSEV